MTVNDVYLDHDHKAADTQYRERIATILSQGVEISTTPQDVPAISYFGLPPMRFNLANGVPLITERKISFWRAAIGEICAFINGVTDQEVLVKEYGCSWWDKWVTPEKASVIGIPPNNLGKASYGGAMRRFPRPRNGVVEEFDQISHALNQLVNYPYVRTVHITPWIPYWIGRGGFQQAAVSPCHGWMYFRVVGDELWMEMHQRSADFPVGVPCNMIQYAALLLMFCHVTGYKPGSFIHSFFDAHIYKDQTGHMSEIIGRSPRRLPSLLLNKEGLAVKNIFNFRPHHFELTEYNPHPAIKDIPVAV